MAFNVFYGIFTLTVVFHMQRVILANRVHKSKGYGGYGYGGFGASDILCSYCWRVQDFYCLNRFCQRGYGGYGYGGFGASDILCSYCWRVQDFYCLNRFCQRGLGFEADGGLISGYAGFNPYQLQAVCYDCRNFKDKYCRHQMCYPPGKNIV